MKSNLTDIEVHLHHETDKAWLVSLYGERTKGQWIPKSQAEMEMVVVLNPPGRSSDVWTLTAPEPLLIEKGLV